MTAAWALEIAQAQDEEQSGRIVARRLDDGRTEFGWQPAGGERVLPSARYFPTDARVDRWLSSSPVEVDGAEIGRINARLRDDGRIEFAFTPTDGERILTDARYFPLDARVGRWLRSTEITIGPAPTTGFVAVAAGAGYTCAIRAGTGAIECWGWNAEGQTDAPEGGFSAVSAGSVHTCAILESGAIECWGRNDYGELNEEKKVWEQFFADPPAGRFSAVDAGGSWRGGHTCAIRASGAIECWGSNLFGDTNTWYAGQAIAPDGRFSAVSAGSGHTCAIRESDSAIVCWGDDNYDGQSSPPAGRFSAVSAGRYHTCGLRTTGAIECWGLNLDGRTDAPAGRFTAVSAGNHTCGLRESGAIECWGANTWWGWNEETGESEEVYGGQTDAPAGSFTAVSAGASHTCAIRESGAIECWGYNGSGQTDAPAP